MKIINSIKKKFNDFFASEQLEAEPNYNNMSINELLIHNSELLMKITNSKRFFI